RYIEEPVEIYADCGIERRSHQLSGRNPPECLSHRVCECEAVMGRVPVAKLIAGRETCNPKRRRVSDGSRQLIGGASLAKRGQHCVSDGAWIVAEYDGDQIVTVLTPGAASAALQRSRERFEGAFEDLDQVDRIAPCVRLLHAIAIRVPARQTR